MTARIPRLLDDDFGLGDLLRTLTCGGEGSDPAGASSGARTDDLGESWAGIDRLVAHLRDDLSRAIPKDSQDWAPWGRMTVEEPPRPMLTSGCIGRSWKAAAEGIALRNAHRLLTDGRIFGRRARRHSGAILIDASGSMHLRPADITAILDAAPGAIVAAYSARHDRGVVRILARHGRRVAPEHLSLADVGPHNVIDLPALQWLASQPTRPRIWISDMVVTGVGDRTGSVNLAQVKALLACAGILRVSSLREAVDLLKHRDHRGWRVSRRAR
jgi:hypothetical protein